MCDARNAFPVPSSPLRMIGCGPFASNGRFARSLATAADVPMISSGMQVRPRTSLPAFLKFPLEQFPYFIDVVPHSREEPDGDKKEENGDHVEYSGYDRETLGELLRCKHVLVPG